MTPEELAERIAMVRAEKEAKEPGIWVRDAAARDRDRLAARARRRTPEGQAAYKAAQRKYRQSDKGKATRKARDA